MKYLITGITGFAGPHLANLLLKEGHEVWGLVRGSNGMESDILDVVSPENFEKISFVYGDLTRPSDMYRVFGDHIFDGVFHLAAQSHPPTSFEDPVGTFDANVAGSVNLIEAIEHTQPDCKLMFCSTSEVYGNIGQDQRMLIESDVIAPANPYGVSKAAIDLYMQERMRNGKLNGFVTRAFSHTGPRRGRNFSISCDAYNLSRVKDKDKDYSLPVGNLETVRVVMDVRDCVRAYYLLMINPYSSGKVYNVCGNLPRKMGEYTDWLIDISGCKNVTKVIDPRYYRDIDIAYQHGDCTSLKELTGWDLRYDIDTTLTDLYDYWVRKVSNG